MQSADCVILMSLHALHHTQRIPVCLRQDNVNPVLQVGTQHITKVRQEASFRVTVFTEDDADSSGSSIQDIVMGHLTCEVKVGFNTPQDAAPRTSTQGHNFDA